MSKRLLLVDDEPNLLVAVAAVLRGEGYEVKTARNGREALAQVAQSPPDLIVSDIRMPGMDGYELSRRIRSTASFALIPIVFLSAKDQTEDRVEGFRSGVDVYLTKPFEPSELIAVIRGILQRIERTHSTIAQLVGSQAATQKTVFVKDEELTEAEWRVAREVARGLSNKEIAAQFDLSVRTVENHISHILGKKGFTNRVEIARYLFSNDSNE